MTYWVLTQDNWYGVTTVDPYPLVLPGVFTIYDMEGKAPDLNTYTWNFTTNQFIKSETNKLSKVDFILRFTAAEWNSAALSTDQNIRQGLALIHAAEYIDVTDTRTMMLVGYCAMIGLITDTRVAEILA